MRGFALLLTASLLIAAADFAAFCYSDLLLQAAFALPLVWIGIVVSAFVRYGRRGYWLLFGMPFALYGWTAIGLILYYHACCHGDLP
jgi:hypothetical protein